MKRRIEFLEDLNNENSIYYIDEIKRLSKDKHLRIYIYNFINDELKNREKVLTYRNISIAF